MEPTLDHTRPIQPSDETTVRPLPDAEWLTAVEAAAYAGNIGVSTIREACNRNELRHVRIGGTIRGPIRTREEWVDEWLQRWARGGRAVI
jgi:excisionase family DNA binding protein